MCPVAPSEYSEGVTHNQNGMEQLTIIAEFLLTAVAIVAIVELISR